MKTLIELYDERPIENVLASEAFKPERVVYLAPAEIAQNKKQKEKLERYFERRGLHMEIVFLESSMYNASKLLKQLISVVEKYDDCILDITGGTEAALFACGQLCAERCIPTFTYSRRKGCFFNIQCAEFAEELKCTITHDVEDCFVMAGGALREGRVDNSLLGKYMSYFDPFFRLYIKYRVQWTRIVKYIQQTSQVEKGRSIPLHVEGKRVVYAERGAKVEAPMEALRELEKMGFLVNLKESGDRVSYDFKDMQVRAWLRDIGSVLELYVYKACLDTGLFNDVRTSAVVDWEGDLKKGNVTNEIDVMAMKGILPAFISCKTCEISTEALNELAILRDRFGGNGAKAAIVTTKQCQAITRHRASELDIVVIDLNDLKAGRIGEHIEALMK